MLASHWVSGKYVFEGGVAIKLAGREAYTAQHPIATIYGSTLGLDY